MITRWVVFTMAIQDLGARCKLGHVDDEAHILLWCYKLELVRAPFCHSLLSGVTVVQQLMQGSHAAVASHVSAIYKAVGANWTASTKKTSKDKTLSRKRQMSDQAIRLAKSIKHQNT